MTSYGVPFEVPFDKLVIAVGAYSQTFGIPGRVFYLCCREPRTHLHRLGRRVKEYVHFLKDVRDARAIRMRVLECVFLEPQSIICRFLPAKIFMSLGFTQASQPNCSESEKKKLLNFVIVGGGPTVSRR